METLAFTCVYFLGLHFLISGTPLRDRIVGAVGENAYKGGYTVLAMIALVSMVFAYADAPRYELWALPADVGPLFLIVNLIACIFIVAGMTIKNPTTMGMDKVLDEENAVTGFLRISRHPMNAGLALFFLSHLLQNGDGASLVMFGSLLALATLGPRAIDRRRAASHGEAWEKFEQATSFMPFAAILGGRNRLELGELGWWRIVVAIAVYAGLFYVHGRITGVTLLG